MTKYSLLILLVVLFTVSCDDNETSPVLDVPSNYEFARNGQSSVDYSGQLTRRDMLAEMKSELSKGDQGQIVSAQKLLDMFKNQNNAFAEANLNAADKQLENKTFLADIQWFQDLFLQAEQASQVVSNSDQMAEAGKVGLLERGTSGKYILVNEKGWEFTQFIEKGLMGATFLHQIYNVYLTDERIGEDVENETTEEGKNYTPLEHHWDEAFGYYGAPVTFPRDDQDKYWAKYAGPALGTSPDQLDLYENLKNAFLTGRAAIAANNHVIKNEQREIIYDNLELASAAATIHYINSSLNYLSTNDLGNLFHALSEAYNFAMALKYHPAKKISNSQIDQILNSSMGTNSDFWTVNVSGLNEVKSILTDVYPELEAVQDIL
ncbi:MAG: DUF4856 domain-containing protein [Candidatus Cyclobacteriaceae bacterium M3_2C_046]